MWTLAWKDQQTREEDKKPPIKKERERLTVRTCYVLMDEWVLPTFEQQNKLGEFQNS